MSNGTTTWNYTYNADGMRTHRTNGQRTYTYTYNGDKLTYMTVDGYLQLYFAYDASGTPMSVIYNGAMFYYVTNVQGDVIGLLDEHGNQVVSYSYDAWGNLLSTTGTQAENLGVINPLRYRSYVYDEETRLYYLQSRYYNPELGRFINADIYASTGQGLLGNNTFAYCNNNAVSNVDHTGTKGQTIALGKGWYYRIDPINTSTRTKRHIHIWKGKKEYIQCEDGSPHDKGKGKKGDIPDWLNDKLIEEAGWDYNGNRQSFFEQTSCEYWVEGVNYTFADGSTVFKPYNPYVLTRENIDSFEGVYFQGNITSSDTGNTAQTFYLPIFGPVTLPSFSFGFGFGGLIPVPLV